MVCFEKQILSMKSKSDAMAS